ncbi:hypothetical protein COCON_G00064580 [Conger conger]|uniref:Uncharacterized protein n=1 Tax=Conger conger TaxID=82655 RepID=A0A9Q1I238_CONCO|nr:hypothetical protein COCON_G00064580 [Conger conger]
MCIFDMTRDQCSVVNVINVTTVEHLPLSTFHVYNDFSISVGTTRFPAGACTTTCRFYLLTSKGKCKGKYFTCSQVN